MYVHFYHFISESSAWTLWNYWAFTISNRNLPSEKTTSWTCAPAWLSIWTRRSVGAAIPRGLVTTVKRNRSQGHWVRFPSAVTATLHFMLEKGIKKATRYSCAITPATQPRTLSSSQSSIFYLRGFIQNLIHSTQFKSGLRWYGTLAFWH